VGAVYNSGVAELTGEHIGFQGEHGAYSEQAIYEHFGPGAQTVPLKTVSDVFRAVEIGETEAGIVPVENSIGGNIYETYDMLSETDLNITGEVILKIEHCLIGLHETSLADVKTVYSHPQAIEQCREFLTELGVKMVSTYDTAGSVRMIKEESMKDSAAIAGERNASLYGLSVIARRIEGKSLNFTRFLIISKEKRLPAKLSKTSLIFSVDHTPGSLFRALEPFAELGINLSKVESRPKKGYPWEYHLFMDFEGDVNDEVCKRALERLRGLSQYVKILGSYPRAMPPQLKQ
jgi:prephenate dehydratase